MNLFNKVKQDVLNAVQAKMTNIDINDLNAVTVESPRDPLHGDLATNAAMVIAKILQKNPREVALELKDALAGIDYIAHIEVAGPGFINFTLKYEEWQRCIQSILELGKKYGDSTIGNGIKVNIEYVSANPTGPVHIGHARGAVYGDALALLLKKCGHDVTKEFYINDFGGQIDILARSAYLRYKECATKQQIQVPEGFYPGDYLISVGETLYEEYGDSLLTKPEGEYLQAVKTVAVAKMLELIKEDLGALGIKHDVFMSEKMLHDTGKIDKAVERLKNVGLIYKGVLEMPKGKQTDDWEAREQLLFKSTAYGDDQDRPIQKADGSWTYLAADMAYMLDKIERNFDEIVMVLGADHSGYVKRIEALSDALSSGKIHANVKICQLVNYLKNGVPAKMSKRSGSFATVSDVINEVGKDIVRFMMLTRKNDASMDFDFDKVKEQSKDNPVFYVQYAYVRAKSIIHNSKEQLPEAYTNFINNKIDLSLLNTEDEIQLVKLLASWPRVVESAAQHFEPHRIAFFLQDVAARFHSLWNLGNDDRSFRFIIAENAQLTTARLGLTTAVMHVINSGLDVIGVMPMEKM